MATRRPYIPIRFQPRRLHSALLGDRPLLLRHPTCAGPKKPLRRDEASARGLATEAVKSVYQHVSSPRDEQFFEQRKTLAAQYRERYACSEDQSAFPHFIGVFDTVAALSNYGSLGILAGLYAVALLAASLALGYFTSNDAVYWGAWLVFDTFCVAGAAYVYTHLKFSFSLPGFHWWETVHLTTFPQKFYDQWLDPRVSYARHAISIDERRADFKRVKWGDRWIRRAIMPHLEQFWFAGNHADIGGGYSCHSHQTLKSAPKCAPVPLETIFCHGMGLEDPWLSQ
jgi:hypothetical protein